MSILFCYGSLCLFFSICSCISLPRHLLVCSVLFRCNQVVLNLLLYFYFLMSKCRTNKYYVMMLSCFFNIIYVCFSVRICFLYHLLSVYYMQCVHNRLIIILLINIYFVCFLDCFYFFQIEMDPATCVLCNQPSANCLKANRRATSCSINMTGFFDQRIVSSLFLLHLFFLYISLCDFFWFFICDS